MNKKKIDNHNDYIYSIVIPVYQSESTIYKVAQEVLGVIEEYSISAEAVFIDDGSTDKSWDIISNLALQNKNIKAIKLLKNYGQHNAVICGFINTNSEFVITMDDDLQNPPSEIIKLIEGERDNDLVFGNFKEKMHSLYRRVGSKMIGYLNYKIFIDDKPFVYDNTSINGTENSYLFYLKSSYNSKYTLYFDSLSKKSILTSYHSLIRYNEKNTWFETTLGHCEIVNLNE